MCGGQISGIEATVHAVRSDFYSDENKAALLVDVTNAFNSLNRQVALHNIRRLCPTIVIVLVKTCRRSHIDGDMLLFQQGSTEGDPLHWRRKYIIAGGH